MRTEQSFQAINLMGRILLLHGNQGVYVSVLTAMLVLSEFGFR